MSTGVQTHTSRPSTYWSPRQTRGAWADHLFDPTPKAKGNEGDTGAGDFAGAIQWHDAATAFGAVHGGRCQRVLVGPNFRPLRCEPDDPRHLAFWRLVRLTPALNWLIFAETGLPWPSTLPADWGDGYDNVWLGATLERTTNANLVLNDLRRAPARLRFVLVTHFPGDAHELDLSGIGWLITSLPIGRPVERDAVWSLQMDAMGRDIPIWHESGAVSKPVLYGRHELPFADPLRGE